MCGIVGIVTNGAGSYLGNIDNMVESVSHRGPDDSGTHVFNGCALGHTRLSVVDLHTGHQPMISADGLLGVTFNGEIYGYKDIRRELVYPYRTSSDTEVILALYQEYGTSMLGHLPGMFAFALWDDERKILFAARDRFGEKPLYYAMGRGGEFIFGSEIKAIIASGLVDPELNRQALSHYLQKLYVHPTQTIYKNIHSLYPAHYLTFSEGCIQTRRYWDLPVSDEKTTLGDAVEKFRQLLEKAVADQLIADVPVGAFLSGGLDSSTIVALASKYTSNLKTYSFSFDGDMSELPFARDVADKYGTDHHELHDHDVNLGDIIVEMQSIYDEPFADSSNIPTYLISKYASEHIKVVLTGDGGDELLGGYSYWYRPMFHLRKWLDQSALTIEGVHFFTRVFNRLFSGSTLSDLNSAMWLLKSTRSVRTAHKLQHQYFSDFELGEFGLDPWDQKPVSSENDAVDYSLRTDLQDYMPGDILVKIDRASMANGLELRSPMLDVDFASFCIALPSNLKVKADDDKLILKEAFSSFWPESVRSRGKYGFGAPVNQWLKRPALRKVKARYLAGENLRINELLGSKQVSKIYDNDDYKTWILLVLSIWLEGREGVSSVHG